MVEKYSRVMNPKKLSIGLAAAGCILLLASIILLQVFPSLYDNALTNMFILSPEGRTFPSFVKPPVPIFTQIWLFNVTNSQDILERGDKPILQEIGPYTYQQKRHKHDIVWNDNRGTIRYVQNVTYLYRADMSKGLSEEDIVTTLNPVFISLASKVDNIHLPNVVRSIAQMYYNRFDMTPFITHSVRELLFHGYEEPLLKELGKLTGDPTQKSGKFGFFYGRNNTNDGTYEIYTGANGISNFQKVYEWRGNSVLNFWDTENCNLINGTTGTQFARPVNKSQPLFLFSSQLCRTVYINFEKEVDYGKMKLYRFVLPPDVFAAIPENFCYRSSEFTFRSSMLDVGPCRDGKPIVLSVPHFYQGETKDVEAVVGLSPSKEEHQTYLDIEPLTGLLIRGEKRIQVNMPLRRYANLPSIQKVPEIIMPILWANESVAVPLEKANALYSKLTTPETAVSYGCWIAASVSIVLIVIAICLLFWKNSR